MGKRFGAIDLGTNSCRLLIADETGKPVFQQHYAVRLGEGMHSTCLIADASVERAVEAFFYMKQNMDKFGVEKYRAIATAACRNAKNGQEFINIIKRETNVEIEIIDGQEEAVLNLIGAMENVSKDKKYVALLDVGGGSTEITLATNSSTPEILHTVSIPWGARNASEAFGLVIYDEINALKIREVIRSYVDEFLKKSGYEKYKNEVCVIATSSSPLRIAAIQHGFEKYDRDRADGLVINVPKLEEDVYSKYRNKTVEEMAKDPLIGENRASIIIAGMIIFDEIARALENDEIIASLKSAKDGIILQFVKDNA